MKTILNVASALSRGEISPRATLCRESVPREAHEGKVREGREKLIRVGGFRKPCPTASDKALACFELKTHE